jgi:hypothetical protein
MRISAVSTAKLGAGLALVGALVAVVSPERGAGAAPEPGTRSQRDDGRPGPAPGERRLILFYTADVHGAVEPCGCTSDPLGDISRLAALVKEARRDGTAVGLVDAGSLLYPEGAISAKERPSADLRAELLATEYERLGLLGAALGDTDVVGGIGKVRPRRLAVNAGRADGALAAARVQTLGGVALGILGVADPGVVAAIGGKAEDMHAAARREVERLRRAGAEVVVLLAPVDKTTARRLARDAGADVVVLGRRVGAGMARPEPVGRTLLVAPQEEMQRVGRLEIVLRSPPAAGAARAPELVDAGGPEASRLRSEEIDRSLERLRLGLAKWTGPDGAARDGADAAFVAARRREQAELEAERSRLQAPWQPPPQGNYLVSTLGPLRRSLPRDGALVAAMKRMDARIAALNLQHASPPPAAEPGRASFVGMDKCTGCHKAATALWKRTVHSHAWATLVGGGKQADYKCVSCHVTGYGEVGGSSLGFTRRLESVQCETCHGPGSLHVVGEGNEEPLAIRRDTPETVCLGCHNEQHSDTFQFEAYMRDIVGPGHAPNRRQKLGPGPTGHDLRSAALAKAKLAGAEQAKRAKAKKM